MKIKYLICTFAITVLFASCAVEKKEDVKEFDHFVEQFADIKVLRYDIPGFQELTLKEKKLVYYLTQAGLSGRDIMWDQNYRHNLSIRKGLENINQNYMSCHLSTSWCRNKSLDKSIEECGNLSNKFVELSAPHPYENIIEIEKKILEFKNQGYKFVLHNYFPPPKKSFVLNIASEEKNVINDCENLITDALELSKNVDSKIYAIHAGYLSKAVAKEDGMFEFDEMNNNYPKSLEQSSKFINSINKKFEVKKVKLCIENLFPSVSRN